jgi:hypothetical protein
MASIGPSSSNGFIDRSKQNFYEYKFLYSLVIFPYVQPRYIVLVFILLLTGCVCVCVHTRMQVLGNRNMMRGKQRRGAWEPSPLNQSAPPSPSICHLGIRTQRTHDYVIHCSYGPMDPHWTSPMCSIAL